MVLAFRVRRDSLRGLLATEARRRLAVVAGTAALFAFFTSGMDVMMPLWATKDLGLTPAQWAHLRSLRMGGVLAGVFLLGALSDRFGQRVLGSVSLVGVAGVLALMGLKGRAGIWWAMPIFGALVSTVFVNLNTLTQQVSVRRQGMANTIYRSIGAAAAIGAPALATLLARRWHGYPPVFYVLSGVLVAAAVVLIYYPGEPKPLPMAGLGSEARRMADVYRSALRERPLMRLIHLSQLWGNVLAAVGAFAAIRFTRELGQSDQQFGVLSSLSATIAFVGTAGAGLFLDRCSLRRLHGVVGVLAGLCAVAMGLTDSRVVSAAAFLAFVPLNALLFGPTSMWVSRAAGSATQTAAFSVHKVIAATYVAVSMAILGFLEERVGIRPLFLYGGMIGVVAGLGFFALEEPGRESMKA